MTFRFHALRLPKAPVTALLAAVLFTLTGCDNPVCVFADGCVNGGGGGPGSGDPDSLGESTARFPGEAALMRSGAPEFLAAAPGGDASNTAHPETPIFLEFSESLNPSTLFDLQTQTGAFQVIDFTFQQPYPMQPPQLVGDGRVVVLLPVTPFREGTAYQVFFAEDQAIADLNGQQIQDPSADLLLEIFIDSSSVEDEPRLIYSYPSDGSINRPDTSEIVLGFDREMDDSTIDNDSVRVTVGGATPAFNPEPEALQVSFGGIMVPQTQVYTWTPQDSGSLRPYGTDLEVVVQLSGTPDEILSEEGDVLVPFETAFRTADFTLPSAVAKTAGALPEGAFGRADIFGSAPIIDVTLEAAAPGGTVAEFFLFGRSPNDPDFVKSLFRTVNVPSGVTTFSVTSDQLTLFNEAGEVELADGTAQIAVQLRNGAARSFARRFDADPSTEAIDAPFFDTTAPVLLGLGISGASTDSLSGEVRDFAAFGRASEPIAFAFVDAGPDGTNGGSTDDPPPTAFSTPSPEADEAYFIAAPVPVGVLDPSGPGVTYSVTVYDQAFNAATLTAVGTFQQVGVVGPGGAPTGSTVAVRVLNARTLAPVEGALVLSHGETGGGVTFVDSATTVAGQVSVMGAAVGSTVITVDAAGFELFTFHGVPRDAVDILIEPLGSPAGGISGLVTGTLLSQLLTSDKVLQDTRTLAPKLLSEVGSCGAVNGFSSAECTFDAIPISTGRLGGLSVLGTNDDLEITSFLPTTFLLNFGLAAPFGPVGDGDELMEAAIDVGGPLGLPPNASAATAVTPTVFSLAAVPGLGTVPGDPVVTIEAAATGLSGPLLVGKGLAYDQGGSNFAVLSALPGVASPGGSLETAGSIDPDPFVRMSATDMASNEVVARPRVSDLGAVTAPMGVPALQLPGPGGMTGGSAYNLVVTDTVLDATGLEGFYRVRLTGSAGRTWTLVGLDTSDGAGAILLSVPDIGANGGVPLANGQVTAEVEAYGVALDRGHFLWTDLAREYVLYSQAAAVTFTQN